jgi:hypothetical protein
MIDRIDHLSAEELERPVEPARKAIGDHTILSNGIITWFTISSRWTPQCLTGGYERFTDKSHLPKVACALERFPGG